MCWIKKEKGARAVNNACACAFQTWGKGFSHARCGCQLSNPAGLF